MFDIDRCPMVKTNLPGPAAKKFIDLEKDYFSSVGVRVHPSLVVSKAYGCIVEDVDGNTFLDFAQSASTIGHCHPKIVQTVKDQAEQLMQYTGAISLHKSFLQAAGELLKVMPGDLKDGKIVYCTTGGEAVDFAVKLARFYTNKSVILSYHGSHHGVLGIAPHLTGELGGRACRPLISEIAYLPSPNCYRCDLGLVYPKCALRCLEYIKTVLETVPREAVAGLIFEPIFIRAGVIIPPHEYFKEVRHLCLENNILLIDDEVFTGFGKTGKMFAIEHWGISPDIICLGKAMGGGLPIGAVVSRGEIMGSWERCGRGTISTFAGHPISSRAAITNLEVLRDEGLPSNAMNIGRYLIKGLKEMSSRHEIIGDVRGLGLLIGVELIKDTTTKAPATEVAKQLIQNALRKGLILGIAGRHRNVINLTPPLTLRRDQADRALEALDSILKDLER